MNHGPAAPHPPADEGDWTLLQSRLDRSFWQWDRRLGPDTPVLTRFVILRPPERLDYDDFDEAEAMFEAMEG
ncbi:hypothetical protein ACIQTU_03265 [Brevundimonas sp. NPDC090276]|uniref:hypothetical protein n=1 Tax=Brevundimonas sp. NPDC090276 TaxID=3363956 RepID=UPI00383B6861